MRTYFLTAPRWVLGVLTGLPFGLIMAIYFKIVSPASWTVTLISGAMAAVFFGTGMAYSLNKSRKLMRDAAADLTTDQLAAAQRAAGRGPIPADPAIRAAARGIATQQLGYSLRYRKLWIVAAAFLALSLVVSFIDDGAEWRNAGTVAGLLAAGFQLYWPRRLRERIRRLSSDEDEQAEGATR
ncbi:hypothetical protein [Kribbella sp. CA-293567]|uniref:hypothetical protein n=1 Tax=Kribbella sp. CA-293567 TaxID=3002436 RepID=UPI0022DD05F8|nr:hypothetical protein [Kribbella sp. CA-293567]WBQ04476.1 hypothetical protein OX958_31500 [Kribbella sp. CA-293567]